MHDSPHPVKHKITVETVRKPQVLCNEIRNFVSRVTETYAHAWCTSPLQSCRKVQNVAGNMTDRRQKLCTARHHNMHHFFHFWFHENHPVCRTLETATDSQERVHQKPVTSL